MTIIFNGDTELPTTSLQSSTSLVCDNNGIWSRLDQPINNVACLQNGNFYILLQQLLVSCKTIATFVKALFELFHTH